MQTKEKDDEDFSKGFSMKEMSGQERNSSKLISVGGKSL